MEKIISIEVSAKHLHLCKEDADILFGENCELTKFKNLTQPSDFAANETVIIICGNKKLENVRVVGPLREETQVELSITDAKFLGINPETRISGDLKNTSGEIVLEGLKGKIALSSGVIISKRHIHSSPGEAEEYGLKNGDTVRVKIEGARGLIFENVIIRVSEKYKLAMHIDTDEGNAAGINKTGKGTIL